MTPTSPSCTTCLLQGQTECSGHVPITRTPGKYPPVPLPPCESVREGREDRRGLPRGRLCKNAHAGSLTSTIRGRPRGAAAPGGIRRGQRSRAPARGSLCGPRRAPGRVTHRSGGESGLAGRHAPASTRGSERPAPGYAFAIGTSHGGLVPAFPAWVMGAGRKRGPQPKRGGGVGSGRVSHHKRAVPRGMVAVATRRQAPAHEPRRREAALREVAVQLELFAAVAATVSLLVLLVFPIFASASAGSGPLREPPSQNC